MDNIVQPYGYIKSLAKLLLEKSYREGDFTLSSGRKSNYYFDCRVTALSAEGSWLIGNIFYWMVISHPFENIKGIAGMTMGADPLVSAVTCVSYQRQENHPLDGLLVRKEAKGHGTNQFVEGLDNFNPGDKVMVLEDVVTTGGSLLKAYHRIKEVGLDVVALGAILDREEGGRENIRAATGLELTSIFTRESLVQYGKS